MLKNNLDSKTCVLPSTSELGLFLVQLFYLRQFAAVNMNTFDTFGCHFKHKMISEIKILLKRV